MSGEFLNPDISGYWNTHLPLSSEYVAHPLAITSPVFTPSGTDELSIFSEQRKNITIMRSFFIIQSFVALMSFDHLTLLLHLTEIMK